MAYGAEIRNEFGELVTDFNATLVVSESGFTKSSFNIGITQNFFGQFRHRGPQTQELFVFSSGLNTTWRDAHPHYIGDGAGEIFRSGFQGNNLYPEPLSNTSATYFYQVGSTGLLHHSEHVITDFWTTNTQPPFGLFAMCLPTNNTPLPYLKVEPFSPTTFTGDYGFQLKDGFGNTTFDSRADFLSISEVLFVPKAIMSSILFSNAVVNLTLRTPVPNCYISTPNHTSHNLPSGGSVRYQHVKIEQTSSTNIRLSRVAHGPNARVTQGQSITNDTVIIVARDPFA